LKSKNKTINMMKKPKHEESAPNNKELIKQKLATEK
jgi:hypothetical protein